MLNECLYIVLRLAAVVVPHVPVRLLYWMADTAGTLAWLVLAGVRGTIEANLRHALPEARPREIGRLARYAFCNDAKNWVDTLRIPSISNADLRRTVQVDGWDLLEDAVAGGEGAIVVTMHLGNFDLVGQLLAARGWNLTVPVERMNPPKLFDFLVRTRASRGIDIVSVEQAPRAMIRALGRHELVGLTVDRHVGGKTFTLPFFGRETVFPRGFASLVRHVDVPVLMGIGVRLPDGSFRGYVSGPFPMDRGHGIEAERTNVATIVAEMERLIRTFPDQWLAFWDIWPPGNETLQTDTVEQRAEAAV